MLQTGTIEIGRKTKPGGHAVAALQAQEFAGGERLFGGHHVPQLGLKTILHGSFSASHFSLSH
jgi:hypothetical protein